MARSRRIDGPYELHPERASDHLEGCARSAAAARRPRTDRRDAGGSGLSYASVLAAAARACAARRSDARRRSRNASGATTTGSIWRRAAYVPPSTSRRRRAARRSRSRPAIRARLLASAGLPLEFPVAAHARTRDGSSRSPPGPALSGSSARESIGSWFEQAWSRAGRNTFAYRAETELEFAPADLPAGRRPDRLLQPPQVPLPRGDVA